MAQRVHSELQRSIVCGAEGALRATRSIVCGTELQRSILCGTEVCSELQRSILCGTEGALRATEVHTLRHRGCAQSYRGP